MSEPVGRAVQWSGEHSTLSRNSQPAKPLSHLPLPTGSLLVLLSLEFKRLLLKVLEQLSVYFLVISS